MSGFVGADVDQLERSAAILAADARQMESIARLLHGRLATAPWNGHAANRFRLDWRARHRPALHDASAALKALAGELQRHAGEQLDASRAPGGAARGSSGGVGSSRRAELGVVSADDIESRKAFLRSEIARLRGNSFWLRLGDAVADVHPWITSELEEYETELRMLEGLGDVSRRTFLKLDATPGAHRLIEVHGDLATADRVIIHIPGMTTNLGSYGQRGHGDALSLYDTALNTPGGERVAVISFMDYDVPQGVDTAASTWGARSGVAPLTGLVDDLRGIGFDRSQLSVVAHSYGSVVAGHAMRSGLDVGKVVVLGSPGMGMDHRSQLGSDHVQVYAGSSPIDAGGAATGAVIGSSGGPAGAVIGGIVGSGLDPVSHAPAHGINPADSAFGADHVLEVPDAQGHSDYFTPGSRSLRRVLEVALFR